MDGVRVAKYKMEFGQAGAKLNTFNRELYYLDGPSNRLVYQT